MTYLYWASPFLAVVVLLATGRASSVGAGLVAACGAALVALTAAPAAVVPSDVLTAAAGGAWLACLVGAVILGGLVFRSVASGGGGPPPAEPPPRSGRRGRAFTACFVVGPFTEAATGFGVGQVAAIAVLQGIGLAPIHVVLLALFSQTLVPWGRWRTAPWWAPRSRSCRRSNSASTAPS